MEEGKQNKQGQSQAVPDTDSDQRPGHRHAWGRSICYLRQ